MRLESSPIVRVMPARSKHSRAIDWAVGLSLAITAMLISAWGLSQFNDKLYAGVESNLYYQADTPRVVMDMTIRASFSQRQSVHPISSLLTFPITKGLILAGLEPLSAAKTLVVLAAGLTAGFFYLALRRLKLPLSAAAIFTGLLLSSAMFIHWFSVVETYPFGALSICVTLALLCLERPSSLIVWVLASAFTLSITVTNWMFGLAAAFFRLPLREFAVVSASAFFLVAVLALVQNAAFPNKSSIFFSVDSISGEWKWTQIAQEEEGRLEWNPADNLRSFFIYGAVAPGHQYARDPKDGITNSVLPLEKLKPYLPAIAMWVALLAAGVWGIIANRNLWPVGGALGAFIGGQAALHSVYGDITFTYAANFFPALAAVAACAYFARARRVWLAVALVLIVVNGVSNVKRFSDAAAAVNASMEAKR